MTLLHASWGPMGLSVGCVFFSCIMVPVRAWSNCENHGSRCTTQRTSGTASGGLRCLPNLRAPVGRESTKSCTARPAGCLVLRRGCEPRGLILRGVLPNLRAHCRGAREARKALELEVCCAAGGCHR